MKISERVLGLGASPMRKFNPIVRDAKSRGIKIYHLNIGQPDIPTPENFMESIRNYRDPVLPYVASEGIPELIQSIQDYYKLYDIDYREDEILVTAGGSEALLYTMLAICDPGDQVLMPEPFYSNYASFIQIAGAKIQPIPTKVEEDFALPPLVELEKYVNPRVKAIMITHPGNPTGKIYSKEEMDDIARLAIQHDLFIIADEVYREFVYEGIEYQSFGLREDIQDRVIMIDSISKRYSACGARIGFIATRNRELLPQLLKLCQTRLSVSTLDQIGAAQLLRMPKDYFREILESYRSRRDVLYHGLSRIEGVICGKPQGAFYVIAKLPVDDSDRFIRWLLEDFHMDNETVQLAPAEGFYATEGLGRDEVRIAYILKEEDLKRSTDILEQALKEYPGRTI